MNKKIKAIIDDGCNPELVAGAEFALPLGIPIIKATSKIIVPPGITPFSMRRRAPSFEEAVGFHEMDVNFADVLRNPVDNTTKSTPVPMIFNTHSKNFRHLFQ